MSFMEKLKKTFLYTGGYDETSEPDRREESDEEVIQKPRLNIGNPMQRVKDIKEVTIGAFKSSQINSKPILSDYTKSLMYESMHNVVESRVRKGKPLVEARLLYRRFLEEQVTDEAMYSDIDLEYIKALVKHIRELKAMTAPESIERSDLADAIANHTHLLNIIEVFDVQAGYDMMKYFCEVSYVICGFSYRGKDNKFNNILPTKVPHFYMNINDSTFILLNEVQSLISEESPLEDKKNYIIDKVSPLFLRYVILNDVPADLLYTILTMFNNLNMDSNPGVQELHTTSTSQNTVPVATQETQELSDEDIQAKMFAGIQNDVNPITTLKRQSTFSNLYNELADPRNPDVTIEELEEAISDIEEMMESDDFELSQEEFKVFSTIKGRYNMMKGGVD